MAEAAATVTRVPFIEPPRLTGNANTDLAGMVEWIWEFYNSAILSNGLLQPAALPDELVSQFPVIANLADQIGAADTVPYYTGVDTWGRTAFPAFGRSLAGAATAAAARTTLGLGALAVLNSVGNAHIDNDAVTFAKFQNITDNRLLGRSAGTDGDMQEIIVGANLTLAAGTLSASAAYSDEQAQDAVGGIFAATATITLTYNDGAPSITADVNNSSITFAKFQNITDARLLGRSAGSAGVMQEITVGAGLSLAAGALTSTGSGGDFVGPASSTDKAVVSFDGITGKLGQNNSGVLITSNSLSQTINQNASTAITISNNNGSGAASSQFNATNTAQTAGFGVCGSGYTTSGVLAAGKAFVYLAGGGVSYVCTAGPHQWSVSGTTLAMELNTNGQLRVPNTGSNAGLMLGGDVQLYRAAANIAQMPDAFRNTGTYSALDVANPNIQIDGASNLQFFVDSTRTANNRVAFFNWTTGSLNIGVVNDTVGASTAGISMTGGHAAGISLLAFPAATSHVFGHSASVTIGNAGKLQLYGASAAAAQFTQAIFSADANGPIITTGKSRHATVGSNTILQSGDGMGQWDAYGNTGAGWQIGGRLQFFSGGTPGAATDMPTALALSLVPDGSGTLAEVWRATAAAQFLVGLTAANTNGGRLQAKAGNQTTLQACVGGTLYYNTTQTGNVAATETDAFSHSVFGATLNTNGDSVEFEACGTFAATASTDKRVRVKFGATTIFDSGALAIIAAHNWFVKGTIIRTGASTQKAVVHFSTSDTANGPAKSSYTTPGETLSGNVTLKLTVESTNANDVVAELYKEKFYPSA